MTSELPRLVLVYNADGGILTALMHAVHKQVSPSTYPCSLCALTYGLVSMRREWKRYLNGLELAVVFHHRDDFAGAFPECRVVLPAILLAEPRRTPRVLVGQQELDAMSDIGELIAHVEAALAIEREEAPDLWAAA